MNQKLSNKLLYFTAFLLGIYLIIRLINYSQILSAFPLDGKNDLPTYLAFLYWFKIYGYHGFVPHWLNGFVLFDVYPPGWVFFVYPIYLLTNNLLYTAYLSLLLMFFLGVIIIYLFGRSQGMNYAQIVAFYALFFVSPMAVGDFIKQGRLPSMLAWLIFIGLTAIVFYYKNRIIDYRFLWLGPLFAFLIITHQAETILFSFVILGLLLTRKNLKEIGIVIISLITGLFLSSFWWLGFLKKLNGTTILDLNVGAWLLDFSNGFQLSNIFLIGLPLILLFIFYIYWKSHSFSKREFLFFSPILLLSILVIFRLTLFIPMLKMVYPDPYLLFFLLFIIYLLLQIKYENIPGRFKSILFTAFLLMPFVFILVSNLHTAWFIQHGELGEEAISILQEVDGNFIPLGPFPLDEVYHGSILAYGSIYNNLNSSAGHNYIQAEPGHWNNVLKLGESVMNEDCSEITEYLAKTKTTDILAYMGTCDILDSCGLYEKARKEHFCVYQAL